jgi:hypothetical protein
MTAAAPIGLGPAMEAMRQSYPARTSSADR